MNPEAAAAITEHYIAGAKEEALFRWECALRTIARLPWWRRWQASDLACKALGIGQYWNRKWRDDDFSLYG